MSSTQSSASVGKIIWSNSLFLMLFAIVALFSVLLPQSYFSPTNAQMISSSNAVLALLALAAVLPLIGGQFDMSIGFTLALSQSLCAGLIIHHGMNPLAAGVVVVLCGIVIGLVNGLLVARAGLNAFITTLATGIVVQGLAQLYTGGTSLFGRIPEGFLLLGRGKILGVPMPLVYVLAVATVMWAALRYTDWGRKCYAIGGNAKAAKLIGIPVGRITIQMFVIGGALAALAGVLSTSILGSANPNIGLNYLLPAFAAVFLGAATAGPGRFNAWGTVVAVYVLAAGISGLQQLGAAFYVEQFFNGGALLLAVALARWIAIRARIGS
ncbi:D-allose transport system permease protein AlsC [Ensifer adhaerens]|nr:D-allose transport system permease protein AlsC [Ensifer adhaerens]